MSQGKDRDCLMVVGHEIGKVGRGHRLKGLEFQAGIFRPYRMV
jgi:hypothetical protein